MRVNGPARAGVRLRRRWDDPNRVRLASRHRRPEGVGVEYVGIFRLSRVPAVRPRSPPAHGANSMNVAQELEELLKAASGDEPIPELAKCTNTDPCPECQPYYDWLEAKEELESLAIPLARTVLAQQKVLEAIDLSDDAVLDAADPGELVGVRRPVEVWKEARAALDLSELEKVLKEAKG